MITATHLTKSYGARRAVDDLTFTAPLGAVTGFLGPNGAGKSTTLRMLAGLARPDGGAITVDGRAFADLPRGVVGVLLDAAAIHPGRTGAHTLTLAALAVRVPRRQVGVVLDRVGLSDAAGKRVGAYSLGMRQRLGLALALLGDPRVLVLDEPVNGLDPDGIRWMRGLLDDFAADGGTVLLSSHLLAEVGAVADHLVVIDHGRLVATGPTGELLDVGQRSLVDARDRVALTSALTAAGFTWRDVPHGLSVSTTPEVLGEIALDARLALTRLQPAGRELEDVFLDLTHAA